MQEDCCGNCIKWFNLGTNYLNKVGSCSDEFIEEETTEITDTCEYFKPKRKIN